jgi:choline transport protein
MPEVNTTGLLATPKYSRLLPYITGWLAWAGSIFTCASIALGVRQLCMGCIKLVHPNLFVTFKLP